MILLVCNTDQVRVKVVHVSAGDATAVAPPGVVSTLAMEAPMQKVKCLVGKRDEAELALVLLCFGRLLLRRMLVPLFLFSRPPAIVDSCGLL